MVTHPSWDTNYNEIRSVVYKKMLEKANHNTFKEIWSTTASKKLQILDRGNISLLAKTVNFGWKITVLGLGFWGVFNWGDIKNHFPINDRFMFKLIDRPLYHKMLLTTLMIFHLGTFCDHARRCQHLKYISIKPLNDRFMIKLIDRPSFLKKQHTVVY